MNEETRYVINILVSMIPIGIVGVFFKDEVEAIFGSGLVVVGCCLLLTALLLSFSYYYKPKQKENISMKDAFIIGLDTSMRGASGAFPFGQYHCNRSVAGRQQGEAGTVLFPDGDASHPGRGTAGWNEDDER